MSNLLAAAEAELMTDFAILTAGQDQVDNAGADLGDLVSFTSSSPGFIRMECGTKYSNVSIRAERWDGRPPPLDGWEDGDELPFEEVAGAGELILSGFDRGTVGLDIAGLERGRVQVMARGHHRYEYSSETDTDALPPEQWLLRLYPLPGAPDPMAGGPRRIAGEGGLSRPLDSPWREALRGFSSAGWEDPPFVYRSFRAMTPALHRAGAPLTRAELAVGIADQMRNRPADASDAESIELPPRPDYEAGLDPLMDETGDSRIATVGDAIDAMLDRGLLLEEHRAGRVLLIPNPAPEPAWVRHGWTGERLARVRARALERDHQRVTNDIVPAVQWQPGLTATPRQMAVRWATTVVDVIGGLRLLGGSGRLHADRELDFDAHIDPDESLSMRLNPWPLPWNGKYS